MLTFHKVSTKSIRYNAIKMADAVSRGLVNSNNYIANVELGNEIMSGSGVTWINKFSVDLNIPPAPIP